MTDYQAFLAKKEQSFDGCGFEVAPKDLSALLYPFQRDITQWACAKGRSAIFADCGLGKTFQQLAWAQQIQQHTNKDVLIMAPLAVSPQTVAEGVKIGIEVNLVRTIEEVKPGITVTNYERLERVEAHDWGAIVLDESSCLKGFDGAFRRQVTGFARRVPWRLACTATPAPNDLLELANHAEFLDVLSVKEIIALFFTQDGNTTHSWRLKRHAVQPFYRWLASWAVALRSPSDLGYDDGQFLLPMITYEHVTVSSEPIPGYLFAPSVLSLSEVRTALRASLPARVKACAERVNATTEPYVVWCHLNEESKALVAAIPDAVELTGSDSLDNKEQALVDFSQGKTRVLVTKPSIAGWGLNWQHCARMDFVGLSYSWESFYQAVRRCWRFGQQRPVRVGIIASENEGAILESIQRKEQQAKDLMRSLVEAIRTYGLTANR